MDFVGFKLLLLRFSQQRQILQRIFCTHFSSTCCWGAVCWPSWEGKRPASWLLTAYTAGWAGNWNGKVRKKQHVGCSLWKRISEPLSLFSLAQRSLCEACFGDKTLSEYWEFSGGASGRCYCATLLVVMIVEISRRGARSLFWGCGLNEPTTAESSNACPWYQRHHSLLAYLEGQEHDPNREKRRRKKMNWEAGYKRSPLT